MKKIAFVPARGGSKSIPGKNITLVAGKPLIQWSLDALQNCSDIDEIFVATDSPAISKVVDDFGYSKVKIFNRAAENAQDHSSTESVMLEFLEQKGTAFSHDDLFVLVQATSPLISSEDITRAFLQLKNTKSDSLVTCAPMKRFFWDLSGKPLNYDPQSRKRRQDFDAQWVENGAFYIQSIGGILKSRCRISGKITVYQMDEQTLVEIDEPSDLVFVEALLTNKKTESNKNFSAIKVLFTDVDGVLTDAGMYYGNNGEELKKFNTRDGKAFELLRGKAIKTGIITAENTKIVENRARKLQVNFVFQGASNKLQVIQSFIKEHQLSMSEIAYIGDDINDFDLLSAVGVKACPSDAEQEIKNVPGIIRLSSRGGEGAVREFVNLILGSMKR